MHETTELSNISNIKQLEKEMPLKPTKYNLTDFHSYDPIENLKQELSPRPKKQLTIKIDYDEEEKQAMNIFRSFSPLNKMKGNGVVKTKFSCHNVSAGSSAFSIILKKSCKVINQSASSIVVSPSTKLDSEIITKLDCKQSATESSADSFNENENHEAFSMQIVSHHSGQEALHYTEEDEFIDELDEEYKKFYVTAVDNCLGNYNIYVTYSLMLTTSFPPKEYFSQEIRKRVSPIVLPPKKKLLILDLDETLIHTDFDYKFQKHDVYLKLIMEDSMESILPINIRPYLKEFLEFTSTHFEIAVFTASCKEYAEMLAKHLDPDKKYFKYVFSRESCVIYKKLYLKFIEIFNVHPKNCIIVDNSLFSFAYNLSNGILVTSFYDEKDDEDLLSLKEFLEAAIIDSSDCRDKIETTFEFTKIKESLKNHTVEEIISMTNLNP